MVGVFAGAVGVGGSGRGADIGPWEGNQAVTFTWSISTCGLSITWDLLFVNKADIEADIYHTCIRVKQSTRRLKHSS